MYSITERCIFVPYTHLFSVLKSVSQQEEKVLTMAHFLYSPDIFPLRKHTRFFLAISWLLGLCAGGLTFLYAGEQASSLLLLAVAGQPSFISLFLNVSLPLLLCAFIVYLDKPGLLLPVVFLRAFIYGYILCAVYVSFRGFGWLVRWMLLFTSSFGCGVLYFYAARHITGLRIFSIGEVLLIEAILALLVFLDYFHVSPFLRQLLS